MVAGAVGYWPGLAGPLQFDSIPAIVANPDLRFHSHSFDEWYAAAFSSAAGPSGRPVAMLSFALNAALSGVDSALPFRLVNLGIHMLNGLLLAMAIAQLYACHAGNDVKPASASAPYLCGALAGSLFVLHPIQLTAVLHDVQRMTLLACTFQMLALLVYLKGRPSWSIVGTGRVRACQDITWISLFTLLGFLSKENALLTPLLLLVAEAFFFSRAPRLVLLAAFAVPLAALAAWAALGGDRVLDAMYATRDFDLQDRLLTQSRVLWMYVYWIVSPAALSAGWHHDDIAISRTVEDPWVLSALGGWVVVAALIGWSVGRRGPFRLVGFACAWFLVSHLMESTVVPLEMAFEHRNYAALLGALLAMSVGLMSLRSVVSRGLAVIIPALLPLTLCGLLFLRAEAWSDPLDLAVFSVDERPESARALADLAEAKFNLALRKDDRELGIAARDVWERLADASPQDLLPLARLIEVDAIIRGGNHDPALTRLIRAMDKPRLSAQDWIGLGLVEECALNRRCLDVSRYERVLARLATRADASPTVVTLMSARMALAASGNPGDALARIRRGPPVSDFDPEGLSEMAIWHGMLGERAMALERIRQAMSKDHRKLQTAAFRRLYSRDAQ